jgi:hypothetical protein
MDQQLVIKLTSGDGNGVPVGLVESPPMLYTNFKALYPTVTFSEKATALETEPYWYGVYEWANVPTEQLPHTQSYKDVGLTKHEDGIWRDTFVVRDATPEEITERTEIEKNRILRLRNKELRYSDFSQVADAPDYVKAKLSEWNAYRQALRDLPSQQGFPWEVTIPTKPSK